MVLQNQLGGKLMTIRAAVDITIPRTAKLSGTLAPLTGPTRPLRVEMRWVLGMHPGILPSLLHLPDPRIGMIVRQTTASQAIPIPPGSLKRSGSTKPASKLEETEYLRSST